MCSCIQECRRNWADRAFAGERPDIEHECMAINQDRLFLAKSAYDSKVKVRSHAFEMSASLVHFMQEQREAKPKPNAKPSAPAKQHPSHQGGQKTCHICGRAGHIAANCWSNPANAGQKGAGKGWVPAAAQSGPVCRLLAGKHRGGPQGGAPKKAKVDSAAPAAATDSAALAASMAKFNELLASNKASAAGA